MNASDKHTLLISNLLELEEEAVLAQVKERIQAGEDPFEIIEDAQEAMRLVGERYEQGEYYISSMMMAGEIFREVMEIVEPGTNLVISFLEPCKVIFTTLEKIFLKSCYALMVS